MLRAFYFFVFFFKHKTAYEMRISDWSSDVCSSDLPADIDALDLRTNRRRQGIYREADRHRVLQLIRGREHDTLTNHMFASHPVDVCEIGRASCRERVCQYV